MVSRRRQGFQRIGPRLRELMTNLHGRGIDSRPVVAMATQRIWFVRPQKQTGQGHRQGLSGEVCLPGPRRAAALIQHAASAAA